MSFMLASVNSLKEAQLVHDCHVDIIDLKQPAQGALGALATETVREIVLNLKSARISATVGDLPMDSGPLCQAVLAMAETGVHYIKIGFFPGGDWPSCIGGLSDIARQGYPLIAVLFADTEPDFSLIETFAAAGFRGVMLDTMDKRKGSLTECLSLAVLQDFVQTCKHYSLLSGLAGSLTVNDIAGLLPFQADYLGFRGALCRNRQRIAELDIGQVELIRRLLAVEDSDNFRAENFSASGNPFLNVR